MSYIVHGLDPAPFAALFRADEGTLVARRARRVTVSDTGFPCRVSLVDAARGEPVLLVHHVSHDVSTPFRMAHAIYVREGAKRARGMPDELPAALAWRTLGMRAFDAQGMLRRAALAWPGEADRAIRDLFADGAIAYIHAHNAAYGCFLAAVERAA